MPSNSKLRTSRKCIKHKNTKNPYFLEIKAENTDSVKLILKK